MSGSPDSIQRKEKVVKNILSLNGIEKNFGGVHALKGIDLDIREGETMALIGENGAGKSTLMKIVTGAYVKDAGTIMFDEKEVVIDSPIKAKQLGIYQAYQRAEYIQELTIAENIFLGEEDYTQKGFVSWKRMYEKAQQALDEYEVSLDAHTPMKDLSVAECQLVTIVKMLYRNPRLVILDEPTAVLSDNEVEILFRMIKKIQDKKISIIYISHRLDEIFRVSDRIAVMRDGMLITVLENRDLTQEELVHYMLGRKLEAMFPEKLEGPFKEEILRVEGLNNENLHDISFSVSKGEILGIVGLVGSKRTELAKAIYGVDRLETGTIYIKGKAVKIQAPYDAIKNGIFLAPEDRKGEGIVPERPIRENITYSDTKRFFHFGFVRKKEEINHANALKDKIKIKAPTTETAVEDLSGGNQQKVVVAKALTAKPQILIFDEPTQGIDVGAKAEIYELIHEMAKEGAAVIVISSEMEEAIGMANRMIVMREGHITGELLGEEMTSGNTLNLMYRSVK